MMIETFSLATAARAVLLCGAALLAASSLPAHAAPPMNDPDRVASADVVGTAFRITLSDGRVLQGTDLVGATLSLALPGDTAPRRIRLDAIMPDDADPAHEILLHRVTAVDDSGGGSEVCEPDPQGHRWMFPLKGQWGADGRRISDAGLTLTCSAGAQGKCVRFGYKPWAVRPDGTDLAIYHQTCVLLVRADYCGDHPTTRNGMAIDIYDRLGIQRRSPGADGDGLSYEAAWGPSGALCVAHTRVPANMTLDGLRQSCPRLGDRLGVDACAEAPAGSGRDGAALMFNRSR